MTTQNQQQPPRPDWKKANLQEEHTEELERLHDIETRYRIAAVVGTAFLGYIFSGEPSPKDLEYMELAWYNLIALDAYG